jgi:hypothetical protein
MPTKLRRRRRFQPCPTEAGDELFPNGIFEFNITRLLEFIAAHAERFPVELVELTDIPHYGADDRLDPAIIQSADLSRPILLAEIAPALYNVIDGHHRLAKACQQHARTIAAHRIRCPDHIPILTSAQAYAAYVECWNSKLRR